MKMRASRTTTTVCGCVLISFALGVHAVPVRVEFSGVVTSTSHALAGGSFSVGDILEGSYQFDVSTLSAGSSQDIDQYFYSHSDIQISLGPRMGSAFQARSIYANDTESDRRFDPRSTGTRRDVYQWVTTTDDHLQVFDVGPEFAVEFSLYLEDDSSSAFGSARPGPFLADPVDVSLFSSNFFFVRFLDPERFFVAYEVRGRIDEFQLAAAQPPTELPLPPTAPLIALSFAALLARSRAFPRFA